MADESKREIHVEINHKDVIRQNTTVTGGNMAFVQMGIYGKQKVILKRPTTKDGYYQRNDFENELGHLLAIRHKNVVAVHGITKFPDIEGYWLVLEYCEKGNLSDILGIGKSEKTTVEIDKKLHFAVDIASGMNICHLSVPPILHRDLKNPNIFVNSEWICKVGDFGLSKNLNHRNERVDLRTIGAAGSSQYYPPEILRGEFLDRSTRNQANVMAKTDVWPFGLMLWEIFTQEKAWEDFVKEIRGDPKIFSDELCNKGRLPPMDNKPIPKQIKPIIVDCLKTKPEDRPSFAELVDRLIDATITYFLETDVHAMHFWKTNKSQWEVYDKAAWLKFKEAFERYLKIEEDDDLHFKMAWKILEERLKTSEEHVTLANFEKVLYWFGPLKSEDGDNLFTRLIKFIKTSGFGFHIKADGAVAETVLANEDRGAFFIRLNEGRNFPVKEAPWTLSVKTKKKAANYRVVLEPNGTLSVKGTDFQLNNSGVTSLFQLIKLLKTDHHKDFSTPLKIPINEISNY